jgi:hypothetical protein
MTHDAPLLKTPADTWGLKIALALAVLLLPAPIILAGPPAKKASDISVTTTVGDVDPNGNHYTISSDGGGSYFNGAEGVISILTANGYNGIANGDWQFNKPTTQRGKTVYSLRKMGVSLNPADAILPGDPHYTAAANPPFWGTQILNAYSEVKCTALNKSMLTMAVNTAMTCPMIFSFFTTDSLQFGLNPASSVNHLPEVTDVQISCNAADSGGCKDWFIEPIGSLQAVGRLVPISDLSIDDGDFYMRFHIHVTRP